MSSVKSFNYDRSNLKAGIAHIGVGNFHRAHQEFYISKLMEQCPDQQNWAYIGIALLPFDEALVKALKSQNCEYTCTVCSRDGTNETYKIGSLLDIKYAIDDPKGVIETLASKDIKIISMTITEGGYNMDKKTGEFVLTEPNVAHDIKEKDSPETVFGYIAAGLRLRKELGNGPVTILSCDNLQHNGNTCKRAITSFISAQDPELAKWVETNVTFPNSMVDRITPAVRPEDRERLNRENGTNCAAPIYTEDFIQWIIEDNFIAGRPTWEKVGVEFCNDVTPYENMKLSLLNASHSLLSYPSFLSGYRYVDKAMSDPRIQKFVKDFMEIDITPYVPAPGNIDLDLYKKTLIERFGNKTISDQVARLCFDGASKIPVYIVPNLKKMVADKHDLTRVAYFAAVYRKYLRSTKDDNGDEYKVNDPWVTEDDKKLLYDEDPVKFLSASMWKGADIEECDDFKKLYLDFASRLEKESAMKVLETII
ncbi:mannitol dehydrogenase family protein [Histomonas meleagridis]|uniref:mannitol dehydrogenase family protein n=1 Tax=Histomonas meleagridis TaxID=135588 RepID=UPI00355A5F7A|nr:mannitol dehydrogenase family protein [Histomonas meleagridis]KAH0796442.1 mannitol dehydrogenase family protein [Histomonas meleagridis]